MVDIGSKKIHPKFADMCGGTKITIRGCNFIDSSQLKCKFGNITTLGYYVNSKSHSIFSINK